MVTVPVWLCNTEAILLSVLCRWFSPQHSQTLPALYKPLGRWRTVGILTLLLGKGVYLLIPKYAPWPSEVVVCVMNSNVLKFVKRKFEVSFFEGSHDFNLLGTFLVY